MRVDKKNVGDTYQQITKYFRDSMESHYLDWEKKPEVYKHYANLPAVKLPEPDVDGGMSLWRLIRQRRSKRDFSNEPLTLKQLSQLLWSTQGITHTVNGYEFRASPSAGALYPIETYLIANRTGDLDSGIYHYFIPQHKLELLNRGEFGVAVASTALDQYMLAKSAVVFIWTAVIERCKWKYRQRAYRYIYLDAGHLAENLLLATESLGLSGCAIGALYDDEVNRLLGVDGINETVIYMTCVG